MVCTRRNAFPVRADRRGSVARGRGRSPLRGGVGLALVSARRYPNLDPKHAARDGRDACRHSGDAQVSGLINKQFSSRASLWRPTLLLAAVAAVRKRSRAQTSIAKHTARMPVERRDVKRSAVDGKATSPVGCRPNGLGVASGVDAWSGFQPSKEGNDRLHHIVRRGIRLLRKGAADCTLQSSTVYPARLHRGEERRVP